MLYHDTMIQFRVSAQEKKLIEKHAKKEKKSVASYLRGCYLGDMIMGGDLQAAAIVAHDMGRIARDRFLKNMCPPEEVQRVLQS